MASDSPDARKGPSFPAGNWLAAGVLGFLVLASIVTTLDAKGARESAEQARQDSRAMTAALEETREAAAKSAGEMAELRAEVASLSTAVDAMRRRAGGPVAPGSPGAGGPVAPGSPGGGVAGGDPAPVETPDGAGTVAEQMAELRADVEMLSTSVDAVQKQIKELADQQNFGGDIGGPGGNPFGATPGVDPGGPDAPPAQPLLEFTPELRESLRKAAAAKGVTLLEDRVVLPGRILQRQGAMEFLAVLPGGKTHESVMMLAGEPGEDGAAPKGVGATLNSCLMALGLRPGTPLRILPGGRTIPAKGSPLHLSVEWEEEGKVVRVNAEDLLWDRERNRSLDPGKFIYVGSFFDSQGEGYVPDLTGDAVACYSVATAIVDLDDVRAANDQIFVACGPRIPPEGTRIRVTFSTVPVPPTRTWDPESPGAVTGGPTVPAPPGGPGEPGAEKGDSGGGR